jgi:hypothetical protein
MTYLYFDDSFALDIIEEGEHFKLYYLHKPNTSMGSVYIAFSKRYILIFGDMTPSYNGDVSRIGYGEDWFSGELSEDYLCEKFLRKGWHKEHAIRYLEDESCLEYLFGEDCVDEKTKTIVSDIISELEDGEMDATRLYDRLTDEGIVLDEGVPGWGYDPQESSVLHEIQKKFSELISLKQVKI